MVDSDRLAPRVVVIGEALVDVVENAEGRTRHPGGSPMNVAFGLGRLGLPTTFVTEFGNDDHGLLLDEHLRSAGVSIVRAVDPAGTSSATARLGHDGSAQYDFQLRWDPPSMHVPEAEIVHTGSIAALHEPGARRVQQMVESRMAGALVTFDPNVRPALLGSRDRARELVDWYARRSAVVKLSDEDADWLFPDRSVEEVLDWLLDRGVLIAALTLGADGSLLKAPSASVVIEPRETPVVDTIGAGDAYMAGLIAGAASLLRDGLSLGDLSSSQLADLGVTAAAVAAVTVSRSGAVPPDARELAMALQSFEAL